MSMDFVTTAAPADTVVAGPGAARVLVAENVGDSGLEALDTISAAPTPRRSSPIPPSARSSSPRSTSTTTSTPS